MFRLALPVITLLAQLTLLYVSLVDLIGLHALMGKCVSVQSGQTKQRSGKSPNYQMSIYIYYIYIYIYYILYIAYVL